MKLFPVEDVPTRSQFHPLTNQATQLMLQIARKVGISIAALHAALWFFHCNAAITSYRSFDRFIYACGALLVGAKLMESRYDPIEILDTCRKQLRKRKNLESDEDSRQYLRKQVKKVFEAQVNIMINIGFDLDLKLASQAAEQLNLSAQLPYHLAQKYKQILTSLYCTQIVIIFHPSIIAIVALDMVIKEDNKNIQVMDFSQKVKQLAQSTTVREAKKQYFSRCGLL